MPTNHDDAGDERAANAPERKMNRPGGLVVVLSTDLFFGMRIRTTLRQLGYAVAIAQDPRSFAAHLHQGTQTAALGMIDFNHGVDWPALAKALKIGVPIIAFGPHKDIDGFRAARAAGVTRTIANGEFSRSLPDLVARYALPHAETTP